LHGTKKMRGSGLKNPVFDIHYNAREAGASIYLIKLAYLLFMVFALTLTFVQANGMAVSL
jgi:hypothetical protein